MIDDTDNIDGKTNNNVGSQSPSSDVVLFYRRYALIYAVA